jgi:hypothetical protein
LRPERDARGPGDGRRQVSEDVRADTEEAGLSDGDLRDVAEQDAEPDGRHGVDRRERSRLQQVRVATREDAERDDQQCRDRQDPGVVAEIAVQSRTARRVPKRPCGRTISMTSSNE